MLMLLPMRSNSCLRLGLVAGKLLLIPQCLPLAALIVSRRPSSCHSSLRRGTSRQQAICSKPVPRLGCFSGPHRLGYSLATSHGWRGAINAAPLLVIAAAENSQDPNPPTLQPGINKADPKPVAAPGPIPILGLVVALAWSRQLRKRMAAHSQELNEAAIDSSITISDNMETAQY